MCVDYAHAPKLPGRHCLCWQHVRLKALDGSTHHVQGRPTRYWNGFARPFQTVGALVFGQFIYIKMQVVIYTLTIEEDAL